MTTAIVPIPRELLLLEGMAKGLAEVKDIDTAKSMRDAAERMTHWAKRRGYEVTLVNLATEAKVRTERRLGELLAEMPKQKPGEYQRSDDPTVAPTLADIGIAKDDSMNWQRIAGFPEEAFEGRIAEVKQAGKILTTSTMLGLHRELNKPPEPQPDVFDFLREGKEIERLLRARREKWEEEQRPAFKRFVTRILEEIGGDDDE